MKNDQWKFVMLEAETPCQEYLVEQEEQPCDSPVLSQINRVLYW
jgi:hypothetical protein